MAASRTASHAASFAASFAPGSRHAAAAAVAFPTPDLLHWQFDEGSGTSVTAAVGPNGTLDLDQWATAMVGASAVDLTTASKCLAGSALSINSDVITCAGWFDLNTLTTGWPIYTDSKTNAYWTCTIASSTLTVSIVGTGTLSFSLDITAFTAGWFHLAVVYDNSVAGDTITVYINGISQTLTPVLATKSDNENFANDGVIQVGSDSSPIDGSADDVRIYGYALTQAQIDTLVALGSGFLTDTDGAPILAADGNLIFTV